jgi:hypothetical protein
LCKCHGASLYPSDTIYSPWNANIYEFLILILELHKKVLTSRRKYGILSERRIQRMQIAH